jgi:hypothetical protein
LRLHIIAAFFALTTAIYPATAAQSPVETVRQAIPLGDRLQTVEPFFSRGLRADIGRVSAIHDCDYWDADLITGSQSQTGVKILNATLVSDTGQIAVVKTTLKKFIEDEPKPPTDQTFILINEAGTWKIDEIVFEFSGSKPPMALPFYGTLHAYLHAMAARNCQ